MKSLEIFKFKITWFVVGIGVLYFIGFFINDLRYLQIPFGITMLAVIPGGVAIETSVGFAVRFVRMHKWWHKSNVFSYSFYPGSIKLPSSFRFSLKNTLYTFAIMYAVLSWSGLADSIFNDANKLPAIAGITLLCLFGGSVFNVAMHLLIQSRLMFENKEDGSRNSLGSEMARRFGWAISPILLVSFAYSAVTTSVDLLLFLSTILTLGGLCLYSSFFSFYVLKRKHLDKMKDKLMDRLGKII